MMRTHDGLFKSMPAFRHCIALVTLFCLFATAHETAFSRDDLNYPTYIPVIVGDKDRKQLETVTAEKLGSIFEAGAGPFVSARAGDWRLSNEHISATFAGVETTTSPSIRRISMPVNGFRELTSANLRSPGAMIDISAEGGTMDILHAFGQIAGKGEVIPYDTASLRQKDNALGVMFEGSPFDNSPLRVQTTYWLAPGSWHLDVETRFLKVAEGEKAPEITDLSSWASDSMLINKAGMANLTDKQTPIDTDILQVLGGNICAAIVAPEGCKIGGSYTNPADRPSDVRTNYAAAAPAENHATSATQPAATPEAAKDKKTGAKSGGKSKAAAKTASPAPAAVTREIWMTHGGYGDLIQKIQEARKVPTGTLTGRVVVDGKNQAMGDASMRLHRIDMGHIVDNPPVYTIVRSDKNGRYSAKLPAGTYIPAVEPKSRFDSGTVFGMSVTIEAGKTVAYDAKMAPESGIKVRVLDAATSRPLAARVRFEAITKSRPAYFGYPISADAYLDNAYIPAKGGEVCLPPGRFIIYASHGICYDTGDRDATVEAGKMTTCTIALKPSSPTPGWSHVELGVRTKATPGCIIEPRDIVQMALSEGIDWLVTGDYEKLTDLRPVIERLGGSDLLGASRGFRTTLPAHPEWGQFLIFPVREDAPDPAVARQEWAGLKNAKEFIATLRRLYPGALIQSELPYTEDGLGYFGMKNKDAYEISWNPDPAIDTTIDAVNLFPGRRQNDMRFARGFWINSMCAGRFYLLSTSNSGTMVYQAEPGYPRLLAYLGKGVKANEEKIVEALRAHRTEITSGPFIDFKVGETLPGGITSPNDNLPLTLRVTAPKWVETTHMTVDKEDAPRFMVQLPPSEGASQRFPSGNEEEIGISKMTLKDMMLMDGKDTLLGASVQSDQTLWPNVPAMSPQDQVLPFAFVSPIVIDNNKNGKYDPIRYEMKGQ